MSLLTSIVFLGPFLADWVGSWLRQCLIIARISLIDSPIKRRLIFMLLWLVWGPAGFAFVTVPRTRLLNQSGQFGSLNWFVLITDLDFDCIFFFYCKPPPLGNDTNRTYMNWTYACIIIYLFLTSQLNNMH
jgi:hypothetical protein